MRGAENWFQLQFCKVRPSPSSLFFFLLFWPSEMANYGEKPCRRRAVSGRTGEDLSRGRRRGSLGLLKTKPKTTSFWVGLYFFLKSEHPKTMSFWGS